MHVSFSPPDITDAEYQEMVDALHSGWTVTGPRTKALEKQMTQRCGTVRVTCLNSTIASLELTLRILGIGPGNKVIVPACTYTASASPAVHVGAIPVVVSAGQADDGYGLDLGTLETTITPRTKVIIPVDIGGRMYDYPVLRVVIDAHSHLFVPTGAVQEVLGRIALVTDGAYSFGARRDGTSSGSVASSIAFSFYVVENLTTTEGGTITRRPELGLDEKLYHQHTLLSLHGQNKDALPKIHLGAWGYDVVSPTYKCSMAGICTVIGLAQMTRCDSILERRCQIITLYNQALAPASVTSLRHYEDGSVSSRHLYLTNLPDLRGRARNGFIERMAHVDVAYNAHYKPLSLLSTYRDPGFSVEDFPQAYAPYAGEVSLPLHTSLTSEQVDYVISYTLETLVTIGHL